VRAHAHHTTHSQTFTHTHAPVHVRFVQIVCSLCAVPLDELPGGKRQGKKHGKQRLCAGCCDVELGGGAGAGGGGATGHSDGGVGAALSGGEVGPGVEASSDEHMAVFSASPRHARRSKRGGGGGGSGRGGGGGGRSCDGGDDDDDEFERGRAGNPNGRVTDETSGGASSGGVSSGGASGGGHSDVHDVPADVLDDLEKLSVRATDLDSRNKKTTKQQTNTALSARHDRVVDRVVGTDAAAAAADAPPPPRAAPVQAVTTQAELDRVVKDAGGSALVVMDFWAKWCSVCTKIAPFYASLSSDPKARPHSPFPFPPSFTASTSLCSFSTPLHPPSLHSTHTHTHTHMHCARARTHTHTHTHTHHAHTHMHSARAYTHAYTHAHTLTRWPFMSRPAGARRSIRGDRRGREPRARDKVRGDRPSSFCAAEKWKEN
jgi:thiol-disulfide isomerase/thioredoxin